MYIYSSDLNLKIQLIVENENMMVQLTSLQRFKIFDTLTLIAETEKILKYLIGYCFS